MGFMNFCQRGGSPDAFPSNLHQCPSMGNVGCLRPVRFVGWPVAAARGLCGAWIMKDLRFWMLFAVLLLPSVSARAASFYMGGVCYSDPSVIVEVWESHFPAVNPSSNMLNFMGFPTAISATGMMSYRIDQQNIQTGAINPGSVNNIQLMDCTAKNDFVAVGKVERMLVVFLVLLMFAMGFQFGHRFFSNNVVGE